MRVAAIDVGTNTVRLLVADVDGATIEPALREVRITRLGQGVDEHRRLRDDAIARTAQAVHEYASRARDLGTSTVRIAGTSALRDALNRDEFARAVGEGMEILEGEDEARMCFLGATSALEGGPFLVCDIGGGSTEFVRGGSREAAGRVGKEGARYVDALWSADIGSVRLRERYLTSDPPTRGEVRGAVTLVEQELLQVERDVGLVGDEALVGVAGTITTIAALALGLPVYDPDRVHGARIARADVERWTRRLLGMRTAEIRETGCVEPGRADVIGAGALILDAVMRRWAFDEVLVSERDILDGLILDLVLGPGAGLADPPFGMGGPLAPLAMPPMPPALDA